MWGRIKRLFGKEKEPPRPPRPPIGDPKRPSTPARPRSSILPNRRIVNQKIGSLFKTKPPTRRRSSSPKESASNNNLPLSNSVVPFTVTEQDDTNIGASEPIEQSIQGDDIEVSASNNRGNQTVDIVRRDPQTEDEQLDRENIPIPISSISPDSGSEEQMSDQNNLAASQIDPLASHLPSSGTEQLLFPVRRRVHVNPGPPGQVIQTEEDLVFKSVPSNNPIGQWNGGGYQGHLRGKDVRPD
ncbi:hypothetical protein CPB86DRAFT_802214 [Serendipita vermifera]|nr:hypothetical protein CPB86DRAFT_802214 [Serendipita vermifera]